MTGTSADGVDAALVEFNAQIPKLLGKHFQAYPKRLRQRIVSSAHSDSIFFDDFYELDRLVAEQLAGAVNQLLQICNCSKNSVRAIGSHGQTLRHHPAKQNNYTVQVGDANTLVALTGIDVVTDFRRADMAHGGQGAPLAPLFHDLAFRSSGKDTVVLNLGGIANITVLNQEKPVLGFDTGPASALMDDWIKFCHQMEFDNSGSWAASGTINQELLDDFMSDPYFLLVPPKSTGREYFGSGWLETRLRNRNVKYADVQATLSELTARTVARAIRQYCPTCHELFLCGGGAKNTFLIKRLHALLPDVNFKTPEQIGLDGDFLEATIFAWLAYQHLQRNPLNLPPITGCARKLVTGCHYPSTPPQAQ